MARKRNPTVVDDNTPANPVAVDDAHSKTMAAASDNEPDSVGYGRPPKASRFQKGQSGNPKGRPKGKRNFSTVVQMVVNEPMTIVKNGKVKRLCAQEVLIRKLLNDAVSGDKKSLETAIRLCSVHNNEDIVAAADRSLTEEDQEIAKTFLKSLQRRPKNSSEEDAV